MNKSSEKKCILLVDEDPSVQVTLAGALRDASYECCIVGTVAEAIELVRTRTFDTAIISMDLADGYDTVAAAFPPASMVPILYTSKCANHKFIDEAVAARAFGFIDKPVNPKRLLRNLQCTLARAAEFREAQEGRIQAQRGLDLARVVSIATGLVMERYRLSSQRAFETLRAEARRRRIKLADLAQTVVTGADSQQLTVLSVADKIG